jgi:hypothetical protein
MNPIISIESGTKLRNRIFQNTQKPGNFGSQKDRYRQMAEWMATKVEDPATLAKSKTISSLRNMVFDPSKNAIDIDYSRFLSQFFGQVASISQKAVVKENNLASLDSKMKLFADDLKSTEPKTKIDNQPQGARVHQIKFDEAKKGFESVDLVLGSTRLSILLAPKRDGKRPNIVRVNDTEAGLLKETINGTEFISRALDLVNQAGI